MRNKLQRILAICAFVVIGIWSYSLPINGEGKEDLPKGDIHVFVGEGAHGQQDVKVVIIVLGTTELTSTLTSPDGTATFSGLFAGEYGVCEHTPEGWEPPEDGPCVQTVVEADQVTEVSINNTPVLQPGKLFMPQVSSN